MLILVLLALAAADPATAPAPEAAPVVAPVDVNGQPPAVEMVCRRERPTGSNMTHKVCRPKAEIADQEFGDRRDLARAQQRNQRSRQSVNPNRPTSIGLSR